MYNNINSFTNVNTHNYNTRHGNDLRTLFQRTSTTQHSLNFIGPRTWNELPTEIKDITTLESFKRNLKRYLLSNYQTS